MIPKTLVIVPCGKAKIWKKQPKHGPTIAKYAYTGAPFKVNRKFAEKFADKWIILSAKYGFINPDYIIPEDYNVVFTKCYTNPISLGALKKQLIQRKDLHDYDIVIALGGKSYTEKVKKVFKNISEVIVPTEGMLQGEAMQRLNFLSMLDRSEMLRKIRD